MGAFRLYWYKHLVLGKLKIGGATLALALATETTALSLRVKTSKEALQPFVDRSLNCSVEVNASSDRAGNGFTVRAWMQPWTGLTRAKMIQFRLGPAGGFSLRRMKVKYSLVILRMLPLSPLVFLSAAFPWVERHHRIQQIKLLINETISNPKPSNKLKP